MPLDPGIKTLIDQLEAAGGPSITNTTVDEARQMLRNLAAADGAAEDVASIEMKSIPGPGGDLPVRVYRAADLADRPPILLWIHGGGWAIGDLETADTTARKLANRTGALVASLDYRLAPEDPFPASYDDAIAAMQWLAEHGDEWGADPSRLAVGGDSAGGNLTAVTAIAARDRGITLAHQLLVYPVTDCTLSFPSMDENGEGYLLTKEAMEWFVGHYLGTTTDPKDPRVSPFYADDLDGLAPATVITAEFDPLRDEGEAYAERLRDAGVSVDTKRFDGAIHGFFALALVTPLTGQAVDMAAANVRAALNP